MTTTDTNLITEKLQEWSQLLKNFFELRLSEFAKSLEARGIFANQKAIQAPPPETEAATLSQAVVVRDKNLAFAPSQELVPFDASQNQVISQLQKENEELKKTIGNLLHRLEAVEAVMKNIGTVSLGTFYDLKREFNVFVKSDIVLDYKSAAITGEALNRLFANVLRKDESNGFRKYKFPVRVVDNELTIREWIIPGETKQFYAGTNEVIDIRKFKVNESGSMRVDNSFIPWDLHQGSKRVALGTGVGKSTHFLRCVAHRGRSVQELEADSSIPVGATLVVPYSSLIGSVLGAHNNWLSRGKDVKKEKGELVPDDKKRVTECVICGKNHTAQFNNKGEPITKEVVMTDENGEVVIDERGKEKKLKKQVGKYEAIAYVYDPRNPDKKTPASLINVMTYEDFLDVYDRNLQDTAGNPLIKPWVIIDEAHTDTPGFERLSANLSERVKKKKIPFEVLEMSATFGSHPTARKLAGKVTDLYVTDFAKLLLKHPDIFKKRTTVVFCDNLSKLNNEVNPRTKKKDPFYPLKELKIKYDELFDQLKEAATDLVEKIIKGPNLVFVKRDYSVGFSFGNVNVISTGIAQRTVIKGVDRQGNLIEEVIEGVSDFGDGMQERGRACREEDHDGYNMTLIPETKDFKGKFVYKDGQGKTQKDYGGEVVDTYFKTDTPSKEARTELQKLIQALRKPKPLQPLDPKIGQLNFNRMLLFVLQNDLDSKLDPIQLFNVQLNADKKASRQPGEYIFKNKLVEYFQEGNIEKLLLKLPEEKIDSLIEAGKESGKYAWADTEDQDDDFIFPDDVDVKIFGRLFQMRERGKGFDYEIITNNKGEKYAIKFTFTRYVLDKSKKDFLSGKTDKYEAKVEIPPKQ